MKTKNALYTAIFTALACFATPLVFAEESKPPAKEGKPEEGKIVKPYKPDTCLVSGEKLGEMGKAFVFTHEGQEIKLCCKMCKPKFDKDPGEYLKKLGNK